MGGTIGVTSGPGEGATFWCEVHFASAQCPSNAANLLCEPLTEFSIPRPVGAGVETLRVLVAEDNKVNQKIAARHLKNAGFIADVVADGHQAIEAIQRHPYPLVFMDVQMPVMDGLEAVQCIRKAMTAGQPGFTHEIRIIAMTANAMAGDREICLAAGMDDYISKPISPAALARVLKPYVHLPCEALEGPQAHG